MLDQFLWGKEAEADVIGIDMSQSPNSPMLGLLSTKIRDGAQHDYHARSRNILIKGKHVVRGPRHQLEVLNINRGGIPSEETHKYVILAEQIRIENREYGK